MPGSVCEWYSSRGWVLRTLGAKQELGGVGSYKCKRVNIENGMVIIIRACNTNMSFSTL